MTEETSEKTFLERMAEDQNGDELRTLTEKMESERSEYKSRLSRNSESRKVSEELASIVGAYDIALTLLPQVWEHAQRSSR
ncbi:hypothetical protein [Aestuariispira insulae]|uniref:Uncharacterized protein n=1 Tax=Aestuariispira insulae TaxID=1461337 RepID=A0A3D9H3D5_9PROT|nr:hypothetical protein [Aestuariispira insulae]RED43701.1 hypothetical protein DFP90_12112 [Aestuariispira insulae]